MRILTILLCSLLIATSACKSKHKSTEEGAQNTADTSKSKAPVADTALARQQLEEMHIQEALQKLPDKPYTIQGTVIGGTGYSIILDKLDIGKMEPLSTQDLNKDGDFKLTGTIKQVELFQLRLNTGVIHVPVHPGDNLTFTIDMQHPENFHVEGSKDPVLLRDMYYIIEKTNDKISEVEELEQNTTDKKKLSRMTDTLPHYNEILMKEKYANLRKFAEKVDTSFVALLAAGRLQAEYPENYDFLVRIDKKFAHRYAYSPYYKSVHDKVRAYAPVAPGHIIPDIEVKDSNNVAMKLSQLRGKDVLVYFWSSSCTDCKEELAKLKMLYQKYKPKGFELLMVAMDKNEDQWKDALNEKHPPGIQVRDKGESATDGGQKLMVGAAPFTFLVDKDGKIIARRQNIKELEKQLIKVFGN